MSVSRLRLYHHFPTLSDSRALLSLLRMHAIAFKTRYERGESYGGRSHERDRLEVWVNAGDYEQIKKLEAALTPEQVLALTENYLLFALSDDELRKTSAQTVEYPAKAAAAQHILRERKPYPVEEATAIPVSTHLAQAPNGLPSVPNKPLSNYLIGLLLFAAAYLAAYLWLE